MPRLIAPAFANRPPQAMLLINIGEYRTRLASRQLGEQHPGFDPKMWKRPEVWRGGHAKLPYFAAGTITEHGRPPPVRPTPRDALADGNLSFGDVKSQLLGVRVFQEALGTQQTFP